MERLHCSLEPGDLLYIPYGWLHDVESQSPTASAALRFEVGKAVSPDLIHAAAAYQPRVIDLAFTPEQLRHIFVSEHTDLQGTCPYQQRRPAVFEHTVLSFLHHNIQFLVQKFLSVWLSTGDVSDLARLGESVNEINLRDREGSRG